MTIKEIIDHLDELEKFDVEDPDNREALRAAIEKLRTHPDAQPNEPLTLEDLRGMVGQPVWVEVKRGVCPSGWSLVLRVTEGGVVFLARNGTLYGLLKENWAEGVQLYRRPPKEEQQ